MALRSTRTKSKTSIKKKQTVNKSKTRRRRSKTQKKSSLQKNIFVFFGVLFIIAMVAFGYFLGSNHTSSQHKIIHSKVSQVDKNNVYSTKEPSNKLSKRELTEPKVITKEKSSVKLVEAKKVERRPIKEKTQIKAEKETKKQVTKKTVLTNGGDKPRLVIVIDDISSKDQIKRIRATGLKLTPSIFPPSELSMSSHKLARSLEHYMIHLPMESGNTKFNTQYKTLMASNSVDQIRERVKEIRRLFPNAKYINNHTGSIFTDDYTAMNILYSELRNKGFIFVDSRTTSSSKVNKISHEYGDAYIGRDIFIDNEHTEGYIHNQLKKVVKIAKKKGYALAIGHPHKVTMDALKSANQILEDVDLVYIDEIYKER